MRLGKSQFNEKVKFQSKKRLPLLYKNLRLVYGFFLTVFAYKKISFDREIINFFLYCKFGETQLNSLYKNGHNHRNPLRLDIVLPQKIHTSTFPEYYHYNPTLQLQDVIIRVYWRVSDYTFLNFQDKLGRWHGKNLEQLENFERIATGILETNVESNFGVISKEIVLPQISVINGEEVAKAIGWEGANIYIEDPRAHEGTGRYISACARFGQVGKNFYRMIVIDLAKNQGVIIPSSESNKTEKNWVVIRELEDSLLFLNQSNPRLIDKVDVNTGISERLEIEENISRPNCKNLNGGSSFVRLDSKHFLRVARLQFPIYPNGGLCRISVLVLHNLEFTEIARSKPFIFNKLGVEICNGLLVIDDFVYFSWGLDDIEMYVGKCSKVDLMRWFNENLQN